MASPTVCRSSPPPVIHPAFNWTDRANRSENALAEIVELPVSATQTLPAPSTATPVEREALGPTNLGVHYTP